MTCVVVRVLGKPFAGGRRTNGDFSNDVQPLPPPEPLPVLVDPFPGKETPADDTGVLIDKETLPPVRKVDIRGAVSTISKASEEGKRRGIIGSVLIEGAVEEDTRVDKAIVTMTHETRIFLQGNPGQSRREVGMDALRTGQRVQALFMGPVMESYPVQATASEIVILD